MSSQIFIVENHKDVSRFVAETLLPQQGRPLCFASAEEFLRHWRGEMEGCVLISARLPGKSGLEVIREMREATRILPVLVLTELMEMQLTVDAIRAGAFDFVSKPLCSEILLEKVNAALAHNRKVLETRRLYVETLSALSQLTPREREVLDLIVEGRTSKGIAVSLGISAYTVDNHRARILDKMRALTTGQLVQMVVTATLEMQIPF